MYVYETSTPPLATLKMDVGLASRLRGQAAIGHLRLFFPSVCPKIVFLQQLYCFQYDTAVSTTPYEKRHISRTKHVNLLQSIIDESLH